jgi:hypothetical protein
VPEAYSPSTLTLSSAPPCSIPLPCCILSPETKTPPHHTPALPFNPNLPLHHSPIPPPHSAYTPTPAHINPPYNNTLPAPTPFLQPTPSIHRHPSRPFLPIWLAGWHILTHPPTTNHQYSSAPSSLSPSPSLYPGSPPSSTPPPPHTPSAAGLDTAPRLSAARMAGRSRNARAARDGGLGACSPESEEEEEEEEGVRWARCEGTVGKV